MDERQQRIGRNEALFRDVNERLQHLNESFSVVLERPEFVCECGSLACTDVIAMTLDDYERIRSDPLLFAVVPGHEEPDVEDVVEHRDVYSVVRKRPGGPAAFAAAEDPRS